MRHTPRSPSLTRRAVLAGAGGIAGAAVLHGAGADEALAVAAGDVPGPALATAEAPGGPPLAVVPGMAFKSWGRSAFHQLTPGDGRAVTATGTYTNLGDGYLTADLDLPDRAHLVAVQVCGVNTTGAQQNVWIETQTLTDTTTNLFGWVATASGAGLQTWQGTLDHYVNTRTYSYDATLYTYATGTFRIRSLRIGYQPEDRAFVPLTPYRVYDSRAGNPPLNVTKGQLSNGTRVVDLLAGVVLPTVIPRGLLVNLTVVNTSASGFLALYANGTSYPNTSSINWFTPNEVVANTTYTEIDTAGQAVALVPANASTDFIIDRLGMFV